MTTDRGLTRLIAITVCILALVAVVTEAILVGQGKQIPDPFAQLAALIVGALLGRLTTSRGNLDDPAPAVDPDHAD